MPPEERFVCRFAAEPPQGPLPYGRWAETLQAEFLAACLRIDAEGEDLGEAGELATTPTARGRGRTYVPVSTRSSTGFELYGYVSFTPGDEERRAVGLLRLGRLHRRDGRRQPRLADGPHRGGHRRLARGAGQDRRR